MLSINAEDIKAIGQIREMLRDCSTVEGVDSVFTQFGIGNFPVKTVLLRQTMQVQEIFDVPNAPSLSEEDRYKEELNFFLDGKWRELVYGA